MSKVSAAIINSASRKRLPTRPKDSDLSRDDASYLDTREFASYAALCASVIAKGGSAMSIGQIKRQLGSRLRESWTMDSLDALEAAGAIERVETALLTRYKPCIRRVSVPRGKTGFYRNYAKIIK